MFARLCILDYLLIVIN